MEDWDLAPAASAITSTRRSSSRMEDKIESAEVIVVTGADADASFRGRTEIVSTQTVSNS